MEFGLKEEIIDSIKKCLSDFEQIEEVILYGSRAKGNFRNGSDIDLTIIGEQFTLADLAQLENCIDDLLLPYKFDISLYEHIDNKDLLDHIARVGVSFYSKRA